MGFLFRSSPAILKILNLNSAEGLGRLSLYPSQHRIFARAGSKPRFSPGRTDNPRKMVGKREIY